MTTSTATHLLTPPQREAVTELARAYHDYLFCVTDYRQHLIAAVKRLLAAQDALAINLIPRSALLLHLDAEAA